jgi:hypothetical protein
MNKALAAIGLSSSVVTILINLLPDEELGTKVLLFVFFGIVAFGTSWAISKIRSLISGIFTGAILGILIGVCVAAVDNSVSQMANHSGTLNHNFFLSLKWILPILSYTYLGIDPWRNKPIL